MDYGDGEYEDDAEEDKEEEMKKMKRTKSIKRWFRLSIFEGGSPKCILKVLNVSIQPVPTKIIVLLEAAVMLDFHAGWQWIETFAVFVQFPLL